jgi:tight adherence protein B
MLETFTLVVVPFLAAFVLVLTAGPSVREWYHSRAAAFQERLDHHLWNGISGKKLAAACLSSMGAGLLIGYIVFGGVLVPLLVMVAGYWIPYGVVRYQIYKRHQLLEEQLENGLGNVANSMRAGLTFVMALKEGARNLPDPIAEEFALIAKEYELGKSLDEALNHSKHRFKSINYNLAVLAILVARQQGGNLSETLERIAAFMRDVFAIDRKIRVMTAEGRFSAQIIGLSPFFMGTMLYLGAPETIEPLFTDPIGGFVLFVTVMLNLTGFAWIQKIVQINV